MGQRLPRNVQAQAEKATELLKKLNAGQDPNAAVPPVANPTPPGVTPPVNPEPPAATPPANPPATPAPGIPPGPTPVPPAPAMPSPAPDDPNSETWKSRFLVLQGKYDAEVPRYASRVQYLENQIMDLSWQIEALKSTPATPAPVSVGTPPAAPATPMGETLKTDERFKNFKDNFPDVFDMVVQVVDAAATKINQDNTQKLAVLETNSVQDRQAKFATALNAKHPAWNTLGQDPNWAFWLSQKDRYSPKRRLDLLKEANQNLDADTVVNLIDDFKADLAKSGTPPASTLSNPTPPVPATPAFVAPPSGPSNTPTNPNANQVEAVSRSFINQFYNDKNRGKYKGREAEAKAITAKIDAAVAAGRVINK